MNHHALAQPVIEFDSVSGDLVVEVNILRGAAHILLNLRERQIMGGD